jgi:hypothetical protein
MPTYEQNASTEIFPDGVYNFRVVDAVEKESEKTHNPYLELQIDFLNDDFTTKVRVIERLVFTPKAYGRIDDFRRATGEKVVGGGKVSFEAEDCIDRRGRAQLKTTSYNGKSRNEIDFYLMPGEGEQNAQTSAPAPANASQNAIPAQRAAKGAVPNFTEPF